VGLIANLMVTIKLENTDLPRVLKIVGRVITSVAIAAIGTSGLALLISWMGKLQRHGP
jgi:hypothetical protein